MSGRPRVLNVCPHAALRETRHRLLSSAALSVVSVIDANAALAMLNESPFTAMLLDNDIPVRAQAHLATAARNRGVRVCLVVLERSAQPVKLADATVELTGTPEELLEAVASVLEAKAEAKSVSRA